MQTSKEFNSETQQVSVLLVSPPGGGKTNTAMAFPRPYFLNTDHKLANAVRRFPGKEFTYDYVDQDDTKKTLPPDQRWTRLDSLIVAASKDLTKFDTIVLDNLTDISDWLQAYIISMPGLSKSRPKAGGINIMEQGDWQPYYTLMSRLLTNLKSLGKHVVVCAHEDVDKDEVAGTLLYRPLIGGKLKSNLGAMFTNVWRCESTQTGPDQYRYFVRTMPTPRMALMNSLGLPSEFNFTWEELVKKMAV